MKLQKTETYQLGEEMYRSEQSVLYHASADGEVGLPYVLKEYRSKEWNREMLLRERRMTQEVESYASKSVVIPIMQVLEAEGRYFELLQLRKNGKFLSDVIEHLEEKYARGKIPLSDLLAIIREIFVSLEALHSFSEEGEEVGFLHLDLHPGNIFLESVDYGRITAGRAKFIDFLTARRMRKGEAEPDEEAVRAVTSGFSPPELYGALVEELGPWTDIYSVCCIFYRIYTGKNYAPSCVTSYKDPKVLKDIEEGSIQEVIERVGKERGDNPILAYLVAFFLQCGLETRTDGRFQKAGECLEMLDLIEQCSVACGEKEPSREKRKQSNAGKLWRPDYTRMLDIAYQMRMPAWQIAPERVVFDAERFATAVENLGSQEAHDKNTEKNYYCFRVLWEIYKINEKKTFRETRYNLFHTGLNICNHFGDNRLALRLYDLFEQKRKGVPLLEYLKIRGTVTGTLQRMFSYARSTQILGENIVQLSNVYRAYSDAAGVLGVSGKDEILLKPYARAVSTYGKHLAAMEELGMPVQRDERLPKTPMEAFRLAHQLFGTNASKRGDWMRTTRQILHYAIWKKDREIFERYAPGIFGKMGARGGYKVPVDIHGVKPENRKGVFGGHASLLACYQDILENQKEFRFTMHLFLKGVYALYMDEVDDEFLTCLMELPKKFLMYDTKDMPIELVHRYCGCILWEGAKRRDKMAAGKAEGLTAEELRREALHILYTAVEDIGNPISADSPLNIRMCMSYQTLAIAYAFEERTEDLLLLKERLLAHARTSGWEDLAKAVEEGRKLENLLMLDNC